MHHINNNNNQSFLVNFLLFIIDACKDKDFKFKHWLQFLAIFFFNIFLCCIFPILLMVFFFDNTQINKDFKLQIIIIKCFFFSIIISLLLLYFLLLSIILLKILNILDLLLKNNEKKKLLKEFFFFIIRLISTSKINWSGLFKDIKEYYPAIIFTFSLCSFIIWLRLLRERLPMNLNKTFEFGLQTIIIGEVMLIFLFFSLFYLYKIIRPSKTQSKLSLHLLKKDKEWANNKIYIFLSTQIVYGFENTFKVFINNINATFFFEVLQKLLLRVFANKEIYFYAFFCSLKLVIALIFFTEIFIYKHIIYFYKVVFLLLVPLIFQMLLYITKEHAIRSISHFQKYMKITLTGIDSVTFSEINEKRILEDYPFIDISELDLKYIGKFWLQYQYVYTYYNRFEECKLKYDKYFYLCYNLIYFISFFKFFLILLNIPSIY